MSNEITYESMRRAVGVSQAAAAAADPINRILTSPFLPQDVKAQLGDEALRKRIGVRCDQLLRQMKAAAGINLTRHDTKETRSAIVLEFVLRTGLPDERDGHSSVRAVPLGVLASQVGVRKEFAEETQRALVHYLNDAAKMVGLDGRRKTRSSGPGFDTTDAYASGGIGNGMSNSRVGTSRNAGIESNAAAMKAARDIVARSLQQPETIRDLSIRLGSMVEDADGSARKGRHSSRQWCITSWIRPISLRAVEKPSFRISRGTNHLMKQHASICRSMIQRVLVVARRRRRSRIVPRQGLEMERSRMRMRNET